MSKWIRYRILDLVEAAPAWLRAWWNWRHTPRLR